jgi:hypothetical protein
MRRWSAGEAQRPSQDARVLARHAAPRSQGVPKGARSARSRGASPALHSRAELENGTGGPSAPQTARAAERWLKRTNRQLARRAALPLQDGRSHMGLTRNSPCSASLWDERGRRCRRATISARWNGGPRRPGPTLPSFSAGSCCLSSPGGRKGVCAWALRG